MEHSRDRSHPWRTADPEFDAGARAERAGAPSGFADYEVATLEAYLAHRNAAFGYPLRAWNGRWIAAGGRSFAEFGEALDETRAELGRHGDVGFNDTIFGLFGLDFWPQQNGRYGLPSPAGQQWQTLDGRRFYAYGDAEYETFRLCPGLFEKGLSNHDRSRLIDGILGALPEYSLFLTRLAEQLRDSGGATPNVESFWRNRSASTPPAAWLQHAPYALERRGLGTVIDRGGREIGFKLSPHDFDFRRRLAPRPVESPTLPVPPPTPAPETVPAWQRWLRPRRVLKSTLILLAAMFIWLSVTAPLSNSLRPVAAPSITVLAADGRPVARRGAISDEPVSVEDLPPHVSQAFLAIEDRRFYAHVGVDPWGIARAMMRNLLAGGVREGGSTITQQLAKTSFLTADRTAARKARELLIALWLEGWLSKEEILSRYLSNVYFGDNVYGLRAAARHYFGTTPERLTIAQAAMLAGVVNAPSRLAPTRNLRGAQQRSRLVMAAMADVGFISERRLRGLRVATVRRRPPSAIPTGTYFADWVLPAVPESDEPSYVGREVQSTLDRRLQRLAVQTIREARIGGAEAALVAMRPDGRVVAMLGGRDYARSPFNRATQARRQPGSTFKLFVYLAALRSGMRPDDLVDDSPLTLGDWQPRNHGGTYRGDITLAQAFAQSSNVVAVRLAQEVGMSEVIDAARDLGVSGRLANDPSLALGTGEVSLLEMTAAYAAIANNRYPVTPYGLEPEAKDGWERFTSRLGSRNGGRAFRDLRDMLHLAANQGTGRAAALRTATFGKTGTTQDYRDALFIGFAGDLVVGVWVGNDDNSPMRGVTGGGAPARIWRSFMSRALSRG